ncbi:hypothetical protein BLOT_010082 [Blomia tropicalis]|nr:hypothetical protein BLOT_010082 [Blomia tropicalis]
MQFTVSHTSSLNVPLHGGYGYGNYKKLLIYLKFFFDLYLTQTSIDHSGHWSSLKYSFGSHLPPSPSPSSNGTKDESESDCD